MKPRDPQRLIVGFRFSRILGFIPADQHDIQEIPVTKVEISPDRWTITLGLASIKAGYVYELTLSDIWSDQGVTLQNKLICYTVNATR